MSWFSLSEQIIRSLSASQSYARGSELYRSSALFDLARQGNLLFGKCEGTSAPFYELRAEVAAGDVQSARCTCPYNFGGLCKHLVALLLAAIHSPEDFQERLPVARLLEPLDRQSLIQAIEKLVENDPDLYDRLGIVLGTIQAKSQRGSRQRKTEVSEKAYRRQVKNILHSLSGYRMSEAYWMMGGMVEQLHQVEETARQFLEAGDAQGALTILIAILEETAGAYEQFDDSNGELGCFLGELGQSLAEAILSADLSTEESRVLQQRLEPVIDEMVDYGIDDLSLAWTALEEGWDASNEFEEDVEDDGWRMDLTEAKLNVLERQGRLDEYLKLCRAAGEYRRCALKLLEIGRKEEALSIALRRVDNAEDALVIARSLSESGDLQNALKLAERGLSLPGSKHALGIWLGGLEEIQRQPEKALQAYRAAFESMPSLELYQTVKRLSGMGWEQWKRECISHLKEQGARDVLADIFLEEEDWEAACRIAERNASDYSLLEKVAERVLPHRPEWVIGVSLKQADALIARTQSKYYPTAVRWLQVAKLAYLQMGKQGEWQAYLAELKARYSRRPALQAQLRRL